MKILKKLFSFSGRATRMEYWLFQFEILVWSILLICLLGSFGEHNHTPTITLCLCLFFFCIIPNLAVTVRRLHDAGKSGLYLLWAILPYIGAFIVFLKIMSSSAPDNEWGPNPNNEKKQSEDVEL